MGIRIALLNGTPGVKSAEFSTVPLEGAESFSCSPSGVLSCASAAHIALELAAGVMDGRVEGYYWYWQGGTIEGFRPTMMLQEVASSLSKTPPASSVASCGA
jgi:hypothetical protein